MSPASEPGQTADHSCADATPAATDPARTGPYAGTDAGPPPGPPGYEVLGELGRGGMGVVYKARQVKLNRDVALKMVLGADRADPKSLIRFLAEAEAVASVKHPHVVEVYEYGEDAGRPYFVMEYLGGGTLAGRLRRGGRMTPRDAAALLVQVARGVQAAHAAGVIHRDLKPGNVLLTDAGEPKVADFGLAKRATGVDLTRTGAVMGTPAYMAPEQAAGRTKFVGPAADVYALGVILYECLTGTVPFTGDDTWAVIRQVLADAPDPPRRRAPAVPRDLERIALKCLEKHSPDRYPSAAELADDLDRFLAGEPIAARPVGMVERAVKWARRKPTLTAAVGLGTTAAFLLVVGAVVGVLWQRAEAARAAAETATGNETKAREAAELANRELDYLKYVRNVDLAQRAWQDRTVLSSLRLLHDTTAGRRDWEWRYVARLCRSEQRLVRADGYAVGLDVSADGARVLGAVDDRPPRIWDAASGAELATYSGHPGGAKRAVFFPDGRLAVSAGRDGDVRVWDATTGAAVLTLRVERPVGGGSVIYQLAVSPDGKRVAAGGAEGSVTVWDAGTGERIATLPGDGKQTYAVCFSADGRTVYAGGFTGVLRAWDVAGRKAVAAREGLGLIWCATLSPDGKRVLTGNDGGRVQVWDAGTLAPAGGFDAHTDRVWFVRFSPDGQRVLTGSLDQTARVWEADRWRPVRTLRGHTNDVMGGGWAAGGRVVTCGDKTIRTWDPGRDQEARVLTAPGPVSGVAFAPDGRLVAAAGQWGVAAWDAATGAPAGRWGRRGEAARAVAFTPDGTAVVGGGLDGKVRVWPLAGGPPRAWAAHPSPVLELAIRGHRAATSDVSGGVAVWDLGTGAKVWAKADAHRGPVFGLAFSPDGTRVASGGDDRVVRVWDAATGTPAGELTGHAGGVTRLAYSPDGARLASASTDNTLRVWDPSAGTATVVKAHVHYLSGVAYAPDGTRVIDACGDKTLKLYDPATGREVFTLKGHGEWVEAVAFGPDGGRVASGGRDGTVRLWDAPRSATVEIPPEADEAVEPD